MTTFLPFEPLVPFYGLDPHSSEQRLRAFNSLPQHARTNIVNTYVAYCQRFGPMPFEEWTARNYVGYGYDLAVVSDYAAFPQRPGGPNPQAHMHQSAYNHRNFLPFKSKL